MNEVNSYKVKTNIINLMFIMSTKMHVQIHVTSERVFLVYNNV